MKFRVMADGPTAIYIKCEGLYSVCLDLANLPYESFFSRL